MCMCLPPLCLFHAFIKKQKHTLKHIILIARIHIYIHMLNINMNTIFNIDTINIIIIIVSDGVTDWATHCSPRPLMCATGAHPLTTTRGEGRMSPMLGGGINTVCMTLTERYGCYVV